MSAAFVRREGPVSEDIAAGAEGAVNATGGTLQGHVINHGTLDPLGTATIIGDYTQGVDGTLILEVAGTGAGEFGQLDVSGIATFDGTIDLDFINVGGTADLSGATIDIGGLLPGFEYADSFTNGQFTLTALDNGVSGTATPEPGTLLLFGTALLALIAFLHFKKPAR